MDGEQQGAVSRRGESGKKAADIWNMKSAFRLGQAPNITYVQEGPGRLAERKRKEY